MSSTSDPLSSTLSVLHQVTSDPLSSTLSVLHQVSATFAASLVTSPAIGAYLSACYGDNLVVLLATLIALADICFITLVVPESLPDKMRLGSWGAAITWQQADPFSVSHRD